MNFCDHKVVSYNVLSSHLADPRYFCKCKSEYLYRDYRYKVLIQKLQEEIEHNSIICLQEVSILWAGLLHVFFSKYNYYLVTSNYSSRSSGYMGVLVAFPLSRYTLRVADITCLGETMIVKFKNKDTNVYKVIKFAFGIFRRFVGLTKPLDIWDKARNRNNQMISVQLHCKVSNQSFVVSNYHMPCEFLYPSIMKIHTLLMAQKVQYLANQLGGKEMPFVLAGDFNITPNSTMYQMLSKGVSKKNWFDYELPLENERCTSPTWYDGETESMNSAYVLANGSEPEFTNDSQTYGQDRFVDTLDYIFLSRHWSVRDVRKLPSRRDSISAPPQPTAEEASDHLLISSIISLQ